jgi:hypothetical protein
VFAIDLYSASVLDLDTVGCFLALHETTLDPRKTTKPPVDLLSSLDPAQSASEKPLTINGDFFRISNHVLSVNFRYLMILLTAVQWTVVGACKY